MSAQVTDRVEVRPRKVRRVVIPLAVFFVVVFAVVGALLPQSSTGAVFRTSDQVAMVLIGVLLAAGALLFMRPRLRADASGVEIRNIVSTRHYEWEIVRGFSFPERAPWARLELPADEYVPIMAIQAMDGEQAVVAMRNLRRLRREVSEGD
ncbi:hypothetical protein GU90_06275 [Saccharopolyspora rectivirgula]|uniref:Low molecular weight protein antigen 6 PH domain-containing protein n=1 Tax=Saccharopolyspora rectivirgula TaxID=28042 RepID=A0A073BAP1_9PSEU|nr:hypothetical protein GU90_06275 [Saccharopolyspora rectivirgula]